MPSARVLKWCEGFGGVMLGLFAVVAVRADEPAIDVEDLRPGLVAIYSDGSNGAGSEVAQLDPGIALDLKATEAPHPRLQADGGGARWQGYVNLLRAGDYRFSARLRGQFRLRVGGKEVLGGEIKAEKPGRVEGPATRLEAGVLPVSAEFKRFPGVARLEVHWESPYFLNEPLPFDNLFHLPAKLPAKLIEDQVAERGRFLAEERSCVRCHQAGDTDKAAQALQWRQGPDLSKVGGRVYAGWIYRWLESPQKLRTGAAMPQMFADDEAGEVERYAVARYLVSLGGPLRERAKAPSAKDVRSSEIRGQKAFVTLGCAACHHAENSKEKANPAPSFYGLLSPAGPHETFPLGDLGGKTTAEKLAEYLSKPLAVDPSGRMPNMVLEKKEAQDLAHYLRRPQDGTGDINLPTAPDREQLVAAFQRLGAGDKALTAFRRLSEDRQWADLGKRLVIQKQCNSCHTIAPGGKPLAGVWAKADFGQVKKTAAEGKGCLAPEAAQRGPAPRFDFREADRKALVAFLTEEVKGAGSPAPTHAARVALKRFNCLACHVRTGEGGLTQELVEELRRYEKAENAEAVSPPSLTGVGHKLRTSWVRQVLMQAGRARPWMGLRMPQFGEANVGFLPQAFAAIEGVEPDDTIHRETLTPARIQTGRRLVGKQAFGCISCHDIAGIANSGTRGPDLAFMNQRVHYEWYRRWLQEAQRMQPGTRMPTVFPEGHSTITDVDNGNADAQAADIWAYLSLGKGLPLPEGLEPPKGLVLTVKDRPVLIRSFMPEAGSRCIAVGYPGGVSTTFDAATCRLAYAWSGNFLDASPVWDNRGGAPAKVLGSIFWRGPASCAVGVTTSAEPPDFAARAKDPAYGALPPQGQTYQGTRQLRFKGYEIDKQGAPTYEYQLDPEEAHPVDVSERAEPLHSIAGTGLGRRLTLSVPADATAWLLAGEAGAEPQFLDAQGMPVKLDLTSDGAEGPTAGRWLVLPQGGERPVLLTVTETPEGSRWVLRRQRDSWQALLRLPAAPKSTTLNLVLHVWSPYRNDPELLKALIGGSKGSR